MRITDLAPVFVAIVTACSYSPRGADAPRASPPASAAAATSPELPSMPPAFHFPAGDTTTAVEVTQQGGELVLDGHATGVRWPGLVPRVYAVSGGRYLLHDAYNDYRIWLWEPGPERITALGQALLRPLGRMAQIITPLDAAERRLVIADLEPDKPALRILYDRDDSSHATVIGLRKGALIVAEPPAPRLSVDVTTLWSVRPGAAPTPEFTFLGGLRPVGADALRGDRLLLYAWPQGLHDNAGTLPFTVRVAALDLASNQLRELGEAPGCWTMATNVPHASIDIAWASTQALPPSDGCLHEVDDATETLTARARVR